MSILFRLRMAAKSLFAKKLLVVVEKESSEELIIYSVNFTEQEVTDLIRRDLRS